jgi:hypothetical protein
MERRAASRPGNASPIPSRPFFPGFVRNPPVERGDGGSVRLKEIHCTTYGNGVVCGAYIFFIIRFQEFSMGWLIAVVIAVIVILAWGVGGAITNGMGPGPPLPEGCAGCAGLSDWYYMKPWFARMWYFAFYCWKLFFCATSC